MIKAGSALLISLMLAGTTVTAYAGEQTENTYGLTEEQYMQYKTVRSSEIKMVPLTIWYGNESINTSVFFSNWKIYVPLRNIVELLDRTVIYDGNSNVISIIGRKPDSKAETVLFGDRNVKMDQNEIPVYLGDKEITDIEIGKFSKNGYNCEGNIYIGLKDLTDAIGYYSYYDENMQLHIAKNNDRLKIIPKDEADNLYYEAMEAGNILYEQRNYLELDEELIDEAMHMTWNMYAQPQYSKDIDFIAFAHEGEEYIYTTVVKDTGNVVYPVEIVYELLPEIE